MSADRTELYKSTLRHCRKKLEIYRDHSDGAYHGGIEHTKLIAMIDTTLGIDELNTGQKKL